MADTVTLDPGTGGAVIATDDLGATGHVQMMKLVDGADGGTGRIGGDATNGLDVDVTRVSGTVTVAGAVTNAGTFAVQDSQKIADNAAFTDGTTPVNPVGYIFDEVAGTALTENDVAAARIDSKRAQVGIVEDGATRGRWATVTASNALKVDGSAVTQPVSGTVTATGPLTDTQLRATAVPVSGTVTADTELPAAAALADATANPTTSVIAAMLSCYNGTTWDRIRGDTTNGLDVDVTRLPALVAGAAEIGGVNITKVAGTATDVNSGVKSAGTQRIVIATDQPQLTNALKVDGSAVTQPVSGTVTINAIPAGTNNIGDVDVLTLPALPAGTNNIGDVDVLTLPGALAGIADDAAFTVATTPLMPVGFLADQTSTDSVNEGDIGAARITLDRKLIVTMAPSPDTEGLDVGPGTGAKQISAASTNATSVKASAGKLFGWYLYNDGATEAYLKVYNKASAPTVGTDVPVLVIPIPAGSAANVEFTQGIAFSTGIATALTTAAADADTGAVAASQVISNLFFK